MHLFDLHFHVLFELQLGQALAQQLRRKPGVNQAGQEHVSADARKTITECKLHWGSTSFKLPER